jgi:hypothetical protein
MVDFICGVAVWVNCCFFVRRISYVGWLRRNCFIGLMFGFSTVDKNIITIIRKKNNNVLVRLAWVAV